MKRVFACLMVLVCLLSGTALAEYKYIGDMVVVNCEEWVSMRTVPDTGSARMTTIPLGATVEDCYRVDDDFCYGTYGGMTGYILSKYLEEINSGYPSFVGYQEEETENAGGYVGAMVVVNCKEWVSMRSDPDTGATRLQKVPLNAVVEDCAWYTEDFVYGTYNGVSGYILGEYLKPLGKKTSYGDPEQREHVIAMEGQEFTVLENKYESEMGFSIWYQADAFTVNDYSYESMEPSFMLEAYSEGEYYPANVEFLTPTITMLSGSSFLEYMPGQYDVGKVSEINTGTTEDGVSYSWRGGVKGERYITFYLVKDDKHEIQAIATMNMDMLEGYGRLIDLVVQSVSFDD